MNRRTALATLLGLPTLSTISVAQVRSDDVIVAECEGMLSTQHKITIQDQLKQIWPNHRIVVCDGTLRLKVLRQEAIDKGWLKE